MLLKFYAGFPYEFQAEVTGHETTYRIIHHGEGEEETLEVPAETWERMLQGAKAENLRVVASYCMAHMQAHHDEDGEVVFDMSAGKEPS